MNIKCERNADPELDEDDKESVTEEDDTPVEAAGFRTFHKALLEGTFQNGFDFGLYFIVIHNLTGLSHIFFEG